MMQVTSEVIDQIVQNVMRELQSRRASAASASVRTEDSLTVTTSAGASGGGRVGVSVSGSGSRVGILARLGFDGQECPSYGLGGDGQECPSYGLVSHVRPSDPSRSATQPVEQPVAISTHVISEAVLEECGARGRQIEIPVGAVVTPSGRDFIRRHNVRICSRLSAPAAEPYPAAVGLLIGVGLAETSGGALGIGGPVSSAASTLGWKIVRASDEVEAARLTMSGPATSRLVCWGGEPSLTACLLNRNAAIRAAVVSRISSLSTLSRTMNPHVWCVDAVGWTVTEWLKFLRSVPQVPDGSSMLPGPSDDGRTGAGR